ncbi:MAG: hypothetical protein MAGBODY4_00491 [Candidatus Marinimicrobia bacterium]|nr:hypothetical protein [Candidatus Neomarinimicrobiota bacterium]
MRRYIKLLLVLVLSFNTAGMLHAQQGTFSAGLSIEKGNFSLEGNPNGMELLGVGRDANKAKSSSIGMGLLLSYGLMDNLDITYDYSWEYCGEELEDSYFEIRHDLGVRYYPIDGSFRPFVKAAYANYLLENLKLIDNEVNSVVKTVEYNFEGNGLTYGLGLDISAGNRLSYILQYSATKLFSFDKTEGSVDFENIPKSSRFSFAFRIKF